MTAADRKPGKYTAQDWARAREIRRNYALTLLQISWASLPKWQKRRIRRADSLIYHALCELAEVGPYDRR